MTTPRITFTAFVLLGLAFAPSALHALDSSFEAMSKSGSHEFYVVCTGKADYVRSASGSNAEDAQGKLARQAGNRCWPVWRGLKES